MRTYLSYLAATVLILGGMLLTVGCEKNGQTSSQKDFDITLDSATQGGLTVKVSPKKTEMTYYCNVISEEQFEGSGSDLSLLAESAIARMRDTAVAYEENLADVISRNIRTASSKYAFTGLSPETEYIVYVFGLDTQAEILTDINSGKFSTTEVEFLGTEFDISAENVTPTGFSLRIIPDDAEVRYYYNVMDGSTFSSFCNSDPSSLGEKLKEYFKALRGQYPDMTEGEFVEHVTVRGEITDAQSFQNLDPETEFHAFAVSLANDLTMISDVAYKSLSTGSEPKNEFTVGDETVTDVSYSATVNATRNEHFAVVLELKEYFEGLTDAEAINALAEANGGNFIKYLHTESDYVEFTRLIPSDDYYLMIFTCNPDGTPVTSEDDVNLLKHEVRTGKAELSETTYELYVDNITQTTARVHVTADPIDSDETFMINAIRKSDFDALQDVEEGLKEDMTRFWEERLEEWKSENPQYADDMTMKEFMSRYLLDKAGMGTTYDVDRLEEGTEYVVYAIGMKPDGTFTTGVFTESFKTAGGEESLAKIDEILVMALDNHDQNLTNYYAWVYPGGDYDVFYAKSFVGTDEWDGVAPETITAELMKETSYKWSNSFTISQTWGGKWFFYTVCVDNNGVPCEVSKITYTVPASGEGTTGLSQKEVEVEVITL